MANGETDARREPSAADIRRRGDKLQVTLAKIELAMDGPARAQSINQTDIRALVGQQPDVASPDARSVESELDLAVSADVRSSPPALRLVVVTMGLRTAPTG